MILECPHCFTTVMPNAAGECPSCRNDVRRAANSDSAKTSLTVGHLVSLPAICCDCGRETMRTVSIRRKISHRREYAPEPNVFVIGLIAGLAGLIVGLLRGGFSTRIGDTVIVRMPQCDRCRSNGSPAPTHVNAEELQMTFIVHRDLKQSVSGVANTWKAGHL